MFRCVVLLLLIMPTGAEAALIINEVAWMGTEVSATDEWIELYNTGSTLSVDGWTVSDGAGLTIVLEGSIQANSYAVLERTDDASAPGNAFLIYAGALSNSGATLTLRDQNGSIADQVAGGEDWEEIGGDNTSKATAQYTAGGWITAVATPGTVNSSEAVAEVETDDEVDIEPETDKSSVKSTAEGVTQLVEPGNTLRLDMTAPDVAYVHQPVSFAVTAAGVGPTIENSLVYEWNFGDMHTVLGAEVVHQYDFPGTYVVYVEAAYATQRSAVRKTITVLPVTFSITRDQAGNVQIHNDAKYEINLSGYRVAGSESLVLPSHTFLLPGSTITIPAAQVGEHRSLVGLIDQSDTLVASHQVGSEATSNRLMIDSLSESTVVPQVAGVSVVLPTVEEKMSSEPTAPAILSVASTATPVSLARKESVQPKSDQSIWWLIGVLSLLVCGTFGSLHLHRRRSNV